MKTPQSLWRLLQCAAVALASVPLIACGLEEQPIPSVTGPSGMTNFITLTATPTALQKDGVSSSTIRVLVTGESGLPLPGLTMTLAASVSDALLSASEVTTGADGRASFVVTAPPASSSATQLSISATAVSGPAAQVPRFVTITLTPGPQAPPPPPPPGTIPAPTVTFTVSPESPVRNQQATFAATGTAAEGQRIAQYFWQFGDGTTATATVPTVNKTYTTSGTFAVTVTVTDDLGQTGSTTAQVTVTTDAAVPPTVSGLTVSPTSPIVDQTATISVTATPATGRRINTFAWSYSDGGTQSTANSTTTYAFGTPGTNVISVTVTDDAGQSASTTATITVTGITAAFTVSPTSPRINQTVRFDPRSTTVPSGMSVAEYRWDFGCTPAENCNITTLTTTPGDATDGVASMIYTTNAGGKTFTVRLTVVDSEERTYTDTETVAVTTTFADPDIVFVPVR